MSDPFKDVAEQVAGEPSPEVLFWCKEIDMARKREKQFRRDAERVLKLYEAQKVESNSFNILYANTETLLPAIYNQLPRAIADRRFHDPDPLGTQVSLVMERTLGYLLDSPDAEYEKYDDLFRQAVLGALVPGRGVTWWKYDPKIETAPLSVGDDEGDTEEGVEAGGQSVADEQEVTGEILEEKPGEKVVWETVCGENVPYDKFLCGYALRWKDVPWAAREHAMSREDAEINFGKEIADKLQYVADEKGDGEATKKAREDGDNQGSTETAVVHEIWWKQNKCIVFFAPSLPDQLCLKVEDPYGLSGFFPCTEPLQFLHKQSTLVPTPMYKVYEPQATELNRITTRITRITNAMKVRGFYDHSLQGMKELLTADDNTLLSAKNAAALQQGQNIANSVWFMPLDTLQKTLSSLYEAQGQCKATIYEITGIADIMRGSTQASETATAQNIKDKWGGLRLQNMQGAAQAYIRDCLRIVAELAADHFDLPTFQGMTNLDYATPEDVQRAEAMSQAIQQAMSQLPPPPPAAPGQPPPAPPPQIQQAMQQVQEIQAKPQWAPIIEVIRNNLKRGYKIDIETNSTLANTNAEAQENINKAMGAIAQALQQFIPAVQTGVMTMPVVKEILLSMARRFEFGRTVEQQIQAMPDQLPPDPKVNADLEAQKQDIANREAALQKDQMDLAGREAALGQKAQEVKNDIDNAKSQIAVTTKEALSQQKIANQEQQLALEKRLSQHEMKMEKAAMRVQKSNEDSVKPREKVLNTYKEAGDKVLPMLQDLSKAHQASTEKMVETLTRLLSAPIEMTKDAKTGAKQVRRVLQ